MAIPCSVPGLRYARGLRSLLGTLVLLATTIGYAEMGHADSLSGERPATHDPETSFRREGFAIGVGMGAAAFLGSGSQSDARGAGASLSIRVGTSAGENLLWFLQLDVAGHDETRAVSLLGLGAHYYIRDAIWARGGLSLVTSVGTDSEDKKTSEGGLALVGGVGVDVFRRGIFAFDVELSVSRSALDEGRLNLALLQGVANWY